MEHMANLALNSTADINSIVGLVNAHGKGMVNPEIFYSKQLLDTIRLDKDQYTYYRYADEMPIQEKADKLVIRRWAPLQAHTVPLAEGVPPISDKGSVEKYEMTADQYGRYMEFTDKVDFKAVDPIVAMYTREYAIVAVETLDLLAQKMLMTVAQPYYAGLAANYSKLNPTSKPSIADFRIIGLSLKKQLIKPRTSGRYHALVSPEFVYDMLDDAYIKAYMQINQTTAQIYDNGTLIPLFGFEFYEVMNCPEDNVFVDADTKHYFMEFKECAQNDTLAGHTVVASTLSSTGYFMYGKKEAIATTVAGGYVTDSRTGQEASYIPGHAGYTKTPTAGFTEMKVQHTLILGKEALAKTGLQGEQDAKMYVKPLGSTGVLDPIDQRQSIGFKINSVGFGSVRTEAVVDYINVPTQLNL